jgi:hypothetical protein
MTVPVIPIRVFSALAERLEQVGFENQGQAGGDDLLREFRSGGECVPPDDWNSVKRFMRLSPKRWAKWFVTGPDGAPSLVCVANWKDY